MFFSTGESIHKPFHDTEIHSQTLGYMSLDICGSRWLWPHWQVVDPDGYRNTTQSTLVLAVEHKIFNYMQPQSYTNLHDFSWGDIQLSPCIPQYMYLFQAWNHTGLLLSTSCLYMVVHLKEFFSFLH